MDPSLAAQKETITRSFDRVAKRYDLLTRLNPGYLKHLRWSAQRLELNGQARILDLCCGTGLSTEALVAVYPQAEVVGLDGSAGMLEVARRKQWPSRVSFLQGDAMDAAAYGASGPFDGILMAYGIRNMPDIDACLRALMGLLAPGGTVCFHEYSVAESARARLTFSAVALGVIIPLGWLASGTAEIYRYLRRSVMAFDGVRAFEKRLAAAGFVHVRTQAMDGWQRGVVHSFLAQRPGEPG